MSAQRAVNPRGNAPKKKAKLGQNFLADPSAAKKIVEALGDASQRTVIEIGPGKGAITHLLAARVRKLIAIEFDRQLAAALSMQYLNKKHVEIIEGDVLRVDFETLIRGALHGVTDFSQAPRPMADVVGNLPYYITSEILLRLFQYHANIATIVIMVQKEVADRIAAQPGTRDYGILSVTAQLFTRVENLFTLPPGAFNPPPKVHSSVLRMRMAPRMAELQIQGGDFLAFVKLAFAQKRKTFVNNLKSQYPEDRLRAALRKVGARVDARAETLAVEELAAIFRSLS